VTVMKPAGALLEVGELPAVFVSGAGQGGAGHYPTQRRSSSWRSLR
jgi:hypothetical protein